MISQKQKLMLTVRSSLSLLAVFVFLHLFKYLLIKLGAYISDFDGLIDLNYTSIRFISTNWKLSLVLWIYLFPYLGLLLICFVIGWIPKFLLKLPGWLLFVRNWAYLLILVMVFFNPLLEIISHKGIYHPLNWLYVDRSIQLVIGIILWIFLIFRMFRIASYFSLNLIVPIDKHISSKQTTSQLIYLWLIPFLLFSFFIFITTNFTFLKPDLQLLSGILILLLINTWLIRRYQVIVN